MVLPLLERCALEMDGGCLTISELAMLDLWRPRLQERSGPTSEALLSRPVDDWETLILDHPAHRHKWYDFIETGITIDQMAVFLLENKHYPVFLHLLEAIRRVQICEDGRRAVEENIADENEPAPHADLMRRMMEAVRSRTRQKPKLATYPALTDRTLIFYYGYYCDPWHLVGSVFATERMGTRRVFCMDKGLRRLGLNDHELAFTITHSECDDHHANDWLVRVIAPSIERGPDIRESIARGIAECLDTSAVYLDFLLRRANADRTASL